MSGPIEEWSAKLPLSVGYISVLLLVGALGAWSVGTEIAGAIVAPGVVRVASERQVVQHPDGGVVGAILARDGDRVKAEDILISLDGTFLRSELGVVERQLAEIFARKALFVADRDDAETLEFPDEPTFSNIGKEEIAEQMEGQRNLFAARRASLAQERRQIKEQQTQIQHQIEGLDAQLEAQKQQLALIRRELTDVQSLFDQGLVQVSRLLGLQRQEVALNGETGRLISAIAEARTRIAELEVTNLKLTDQRREDAISRLRDMQYKEIELAERQISLGERLTRLDVRAPMSGVVFGSHVVALHSVIRPAEPMMYLVPGDEPLQISARIRPTDVEEVMAGQDVVLMFTTFNRRTTPEIPGRLLRVSPDVATDERTGESFYEAILIPDQAALDAVPGLRPIPGMPVEAFLKTRNRTPLSYLVQPLAVYFYRAFREG